MENIQHSLPKRSYASNGYISHKSVYDDVFGGPPKFGLPTLAPRFEDYAEIFGGFHSARSSSIPVLDLPAIDDDAGFHFDVRGPHFNYSDVFGDLGGMDFALSYEELVGHSSAGYDSSDEAWSPAHSESLSVESEPSASSAKHHNLSNGDHLQSFDDVKLFNQTLSTGSTSVTQLPAISGYAYTFNDMSVSGTSEDEKSSLNKDLERSVSHAGTGAEEKLFMKSLSHPSNNNAKHDRNFLEKPKSTLSKPFITISDINLKTKPSGLPPPARPPPTFAAENRESDPQYAKPKAFNDSSFQRSDSSSLFFDVEVDTSSSAEAMKGAREKDQGKHLHTKESGERSDGHESRTNLHLNNNIEVERKTSMTFSLTNRFSDEKMLQSHAKEAKVPKPFVEEKRSLTEKNKVISDSIDRENHIHFVEKSVDTVSWSEETDFFEVIHSNVPRRASKIEDGNSLMQSMRSCSYRQQQNVDSKAYDRIQDCKNFNVVKEAPRWDEDENQLEMDMDICDWEYNQGRLVATKKSSHQELHEEVQLDEMICKFDSNEKARVVRKHGQNEKVLFDPDESVDKLTKAWCYLNEVEAQRKLKADTKRIESRKTSKDAHLRKENGMRRDNEREQYERRLEEAFEHIDLGKRAREKQEHEEREKQKQDNCGKGEDNNKGKLSHERNESGNTPKEPFELKGNEKRLDGDVKHEKIYKISDMDLGKIMNCRDEKLGIKARGGKEGHVEAHKEEENEIKCKELVQSKNSRILWLDDHESHKIKQRPTNTYGRKESELEQKEFRAQKDDKRSAMVFKEEETVKRSLGACDIEVNENLSEDAGSWDELSGQDIEIELNEGNIHEGDVRNDHETDDLIEACNLEAFNEECKSNDGDLLETPITVKYDSPGESEAIRTFDAGEENEKLVAERRNTDFETSDGTNMLLKGKLNSSTQKTDDMEDQKDENSFTESHCVPESITNSKKAEGDMGSVCYMPEKSASEVISNHENEASLAREEETEKSIKGVQSNVKKNEIGDKSISGHMATEMAQNDKEMEGASSVVLEERENRLKMGQPCQNHCTERKEKNLKETLTRKDQKVDRRRERERELENEHQRKLEEEREREREREKDRMSLSRAAFEAHERSYAEARERAERAAVERATAEARQRAISEARERLDRASMEARLRPDRASVERPAVEAWHRAVKKSLVENRTFEVREQVGKSLADRYSGSSRCVETRDAALSELHDHQFRSTANLNGLRYAYSSAHVGAEGESPQRCKARLQRYQRTNERAAKALAEKNMRDLLAQREQEERNRLAETLDIEVKRWSSGKEGNLRALLSTLQYILGPDSGWQPIPLTEVITSAAVKKAYRKATLCVHPDKLQQRSASIHQKYICEKVFDLLKEAWNKFSSEER